MTAPHVPARYRTVLANRDYTLLWAGQVTSQLGDAVYEIALIWLALQLTDQDFSSVGLVVFARLVPYVLIGPFAGVMVDRFDRRRIMVVADIGRAVVVLLVPFVHAVGTLRLWHLALTAFLLTALRTFFNPAMQATLPRVAPGPALVPANGLLQASTQTATVIGPALAGLLLVVIEPEVLFIVDGATFLVSAVTVGLIRGARGRAEVGAGGGVLADLAGSVRVVRRQRTLWWAMVLFSAGLLTVAGAYRVGLPALASDVLSGGSKTYGLLVSVLGAGTVLGGLVVGKLRTGDRDAAVLFGGWVLWGGCFALLGLGGGLALALLLALIAGVAESAVTVLTVSLVQRSVPENDLGKVFSLWSLLNSSGESASGLAVGWGLDGFPTGAVFVVSGCATMLVGAVGLLLTGGRARATPLDVGSHVKET